MDNFDREASILRYAGPLADRVEFIPEVPRDVIDETTRGILFVMAFWSSPAVLAFEKIVQTVSRPDGNGRLRLIVADADAIPPQMHESAPFIDVVGGWGETLWIRNGQVVSRFTPGLNSDLLESNTLALLDETG